MSQAVTDELPMRKGGVVSVKKREPLTQRGQLVGREQDQKKSKSGTLQPEWSTMGF